MRSCACTCTDAACVCTHVYTRMVCMGAFRSVCHRRQLQLPSLKPHRMLCDLWQCWCPDHHPHMHELSWCTCGGQLVRQLCDEQHTVPSSPSMYACACTHMTHTHTPRQWFATLRAGSGTNRAGKVRFRAPMGPLDESIAGLVKGNIFPPPSVFSDPIIGKHNCIIAPPRQHCKPVRLSLYHVHRSLPRVFGSHCSAPTCLRIHTPCHTLSTLVCTHARCDMAITTAISLCPHTHAGMHTGMHACSTSVYTQAMHKRP